jgi:hypothetical protein
MRRSELVAALLFVACSRTTLDELEPFPYEPSTGGSPSGGQGGAFGGTNGARGGSVPTGGSVSTGGSVPTGGVGTGGIATGGAAGSGAFGGMTPPAYALVGSPYVYNPTADGFSLSVVMASGAPGTVRAAVRPAAGGPWMEQGTVEYPTADAL